MMRPLLVLFALLTLLTGLAYPVAVTGIGRLFFADKVKGVLVLRTMDPQKFHLCIKQRRCWLCGKPRPWPAFRSTAQ